jgi:hypothetical protein
MIAVVQPYLTGDNTLRYIHDLDRWDKHRLVLTTATAIKKWSVVIQPGREIGWPEPSVPLKQGYEIVNIPRDTYERTGHENFKLGLDIAFGQSEVVAGKPVLETLHGMLNLVDNLVSNFAPFLS